MNTIKVIFCLFAMVLLSACVSFPNTVPFDLPEGGKVAYDIKLEEEIGHSHVGTTVFNNFERVKQGAHWELNAFAISETERLLTHYGFTPLKLDPFVSEITEKLNEGVSDEKAVKLNEEQEELVEKEREAYYEQLAADGIQAIIRFWSTADSVSVYSECGAYGCTEFYAKNPGVFSRSIVFLGSHISAVLPSVSGASLINPKSPIYTDKMPDVDLRADTNHMKGFKPEDLKNMSDEEWSEVETKVKEIITRKVLLNVKALKAGADGEGGFLRDPATL